MATAIENGTMDLIDVMALLTKRALNNKCDGENCDKKPPHTGCEGCRASRAMNEVSDILRQAI